MDVFAFIPGKDDSKILIRGHCPLGHKLEMVPPSLVPPSVGWSCDNLNCDRDGRGDRWRCKSCDFDLCQVCYPEVAGRGGRPGGRRVLAGAGGAGAVQASKPGPAAGGGDARQGALPGVPPHGGRQPAAASGLAEALRVAAAHARRHARAARHPVSAQPGEREEHGAAPGHQGGERAAGPVRHRAHRRRRPGSPPRLPRGPPPRLHQEPRRHLRLHLPGVRLAGQLLTGRPAVNPDPSVRPQDLATSMRRAKAKGAAALADPRAGPWNPRVSLGLAEVGVSLIQSDEEERMTLQDALAQIETLIQIETIIAQVLPPPVPAAAPPPPSSLSSCSSSSHGCPLPQGGTPPRSLAPPLLSLTPPPIQTLSSSLLLLLLHFLLLIL
eukprot:3311727-Rhodomonas_salina.2